MKTLSDLPPAVTETNIPGFQKRQGKVRDTYDLGNGTLLMIATDRISTYDVVHPTGIPEKGKILTSMTLFWFKKLKELIPELEHHMITSDIGEYGAGWNNYRNQLEGRSMLVRKADIYPIECIARGYITGSGWKDYLKDGAICGIKLPEGLQQCQKFENPIFTPSTKAETGHDENITLADASNRIGEEVMKRLGAMTLNVYKNAAAWAEAHGVLLADTKLEWGSHEGKTILCDEVLTPDSSRFWPKDGYEVGHDQFSFDKQYVRNDVSALGWDKKPPAPPLSDEVVLNTREKYVEAHNRVTGEKFAA